jgi:hypothetical protein
MILTALALRMQGRDRLNVIDTGMMLGSPGPPVSWDCTELLRQIQVMAGKLYFDDQLGER